VASQLLAMRLSSSSSWERVERVGLAREGVKGGSESGEGGQGAAVGS
jgi:hypothetical protein